MIGKGHGILGWGVLACAAAALLTASAAADDYAAVPTIRSGDPAAIALDPNDPVPEIGFPHCHYCERWRDEDWRRHHRGHDRDYDRDRDRGYDHDHDGDREWARHHHWRGEWPGPDPQTALVDCSGRTPRAFRSVTEAAQFTPPNGRILIVPPGAGMTCVETVHAFGPVTIASADPQASAVIQAPAHQPCLVADIPLGDTLVVENVKFIARGEEEPCVEVQAGAVAMRHVHVDSRNTQWAFNVEQSGNLTLENSRIETDGSGVFASRATVHLSADEIDVEEGQNGVGLALDRTDGAVEGGAVLGGRWGAVVSAGPRGLMLSHFAVTKAQTGLVVAGGEQGTVTVQSLGFGDNRDGVLVMPGSDIRMSDLTVTSTRGTAVSLFGGRTVLSDSHIFGARVGIAQVPPTGWHSDGWDHFFHRHDLQEPVVPAPASESPIGRSAEIVNNEIKGVAVGIFAGGEGRTLIAGNDIHAKDDCIKGDRHAEEHDNRCHD